MNTKNSALLFTLGSACGVMLAMGLNAQTRAKPATTNLAVSRILAESPANAAPAGPAHLQFFTYPNGNTGIYDPSTATIYIYDYDLAQCLNVRELTSLGSPMRRVR